MNIEHRTLNVQHRIMYSVNFNKKLSEGNLLFDVRRSICSLFRPGGISYLHNEVLHEGLGELRDRKARFCSEELYNNLCG